LIENNQLARVGVGRDLGHFTIALGTMQHARVPYYRTI
jgi:hypothetical protein